MALQIITFLIAGAAPLFIVLALKIFSHKRFFDSPKNWILFALGGVLVYNLVFLKWSTEHEFAWMAFFLVLTIFLVPFFHKITNSKYGFVGMGALLLIAVIQYFLINLPGSKTRKGELYAAQQMLGENIKDTITADATILTNLSNEKIVEYYAGRTFNQVKDLQQAMQLTDSLHLKLAVWLEVDHGKIVVVKPLNNQP